MVGRLRRMHTSAAAGRLRRPDPWETASRRLSVPAGTFLRYLPEGLDLGLLTLSTRLEYDHCVEATAPRQETERVIAEAEARGWRVVHPMGHWGYL